MYSFDILSSVLGKDYRFGCWFGFGNIEVCSSGDSTGDNIGGYDNSTSVRRFSYAIRGSVEVKFNSPQESGHLADPIRIIHRHCMHEDLEFDTPRSTSTTQRPVVPVRYFHSYRVLFASLCMYSSILPDVELVIQHPNYLPIILIDQHQSASQVSIRIETMSWSGW